LNAAAPALVAADGITKRFGSLVANDNVSFDARAGEVHALIGENGAGKSTLMSVLYGLLRPDAGRVLVDGRPVRFNSCADAMRCGIGMVFQHFLLIERFSVAHNVLLGREPAARGLIDRRSAQAEVARVAARYGFALDPNAPVEQLGVGARQQVELLKVLERDARILILDEPTAALTPQETAALFDVVRRLRAEGRAVIFIAHKLKEVLAIADRITVLRRGRVVGSVPRCEADESLLGTLMVGRAVDVDARMPRQTQPAGAVLRVRDMRVLRDDGSAGLEGLSLEARAGEILGIAGVEGSGQSELCEALYGLRAVDGGKIELQGLDITRKSTCERRFLGLRYVPPDRQREGLVLDFDTLENALLGDQRRFAKGVLVDRAAADRRAGEIARQYDIAAFNPSLPARAYSGGNQQKLVIGRELTDDAVAVIACAPTRGVDVGATVAIHAKLRAIRDKGVAIVLVSYDLDELRALSDRIVVLCGGEAAGELRPEESDDATLGMLMGGVHA
jgi:simple sugar transport system ATP-binding protein